MDQPYYQSGEEDAITGDKQVYVLPKTPEDGQLLLVYEIPGVGAIATGWREIETGYQTERVGTIGIFLFLDPNTPIYLFPAGGFLVKKYRTDRAQRHARAEVGGLRLLRQHLGDFWGIPKLLRAYLDKTPAAVVTDCFPALPHREILQMMTPIIQYYKDSGADDQEIAQLEERWNVLVASTLLIALYDGIEISEKLSKVGLIHDDLLNTKPGRGTRLAGNILFGIPEACAPWVDFGWAKEVIPLGLFKRTRTEAFIYNVEDLIEELRQLSLDEDLCKDLLDIMSKTRKDRQVADASKQMRQRVEDYVHESYGKPSIDTLRQVISGEVFNIVVWARVLEATRRTGQEVMLSTEAVQKIRQIYNEKFAPRKIVQEVNDID